jgi:hypothetical protein
VPAPIKAPLAVLSGSPFGDTQPVNPTAETANDKVKICSFINQNSLFQTTKGISAFKNQPAVAVCEHRFHGRFCFPRRWVQQTSYSAPGKFPARPVTNEKVQPDGMSCLAPPAAFQ